MISLNQKFPRRKLIAVFHNGGVTKRDSELGPYMLKFEKIFLSDYLEASTKGNLTRYRNQLRNLSFGILRFPFKLLGFIASANNDTNFAGLRPWVISIRGHYSNRKIPREVSSAIEHALFQKPITHGSKDPLNVIALHFRLGDLLHIESKKPLKIESLAIGVKMARELFPDRNSPIAICSDSVDVAKTNLERQFPNEKFISLPMAPRETIGFLYGVSCFVGTPSKISEWVTIFRVNSGNEHLTFLPRQMCSQVSRILDETPLIQYY